MLLIASLYRHGKFTAQWLARDGRIRSVNLACQFDRPPDAPTVHLFAYNDTLYAMIHSCRGFTIWEVSDDHIVHRFGCHCEFPAAYYICAKGLSSSRSCVYIGYHYDYIVKFRRDGLVRRVKHYRRHVGAKLNAIPSRFGEEVSLSAICSITNKLQLHRCKFHDVMSIWGDMWLVRDNNAMIMVQYCTQRRQIVWTMGFGTTGIRHAQYLSESVIQCITLNGTIIIVNTVDDSRY